MVHQHEETTVYNDTTTRMDRLVWGPIVSLTQVVFHPTHFFPRSAR